METAENRPVENAMRKRVVERPVVSARVCSNPDCERVTDDENETICVECGWSTRKGK